MQQCINGNGRKRSLCDKDDAHNLAKIGNEIFIIPKTCRSERRCVQGIECGLSTGCYISPQYYIQTPPWVISINEFERCGCPHEEPRGFLHKLAEDIFSRPLC